MTQWNEPEHTCEDCDEHTGKVCMNRNSDHYGHFVLPVHPACEHAVLIPEYVHHVNCAIHNGGQCDCLNCKS